MRRRRSRWVALGLAGLVLTGCWDMRDVEDRATVLVSGADRCADDEPCRMRMTWQIAIPGGIPLGGAEGHATGESVYVLSAEGKDDADAQGKAQAELNRRMDFGHIRVFLISEELAREGIYSYMEWIRGLAQLRPVQWVAIAQGSAGQVVRASPALHRVPALYLTEMFDEAVQNGRMPNVTLGDLKIRLSNRGEDAVVPLIRMGDGDLPELTGLAVFRNHTMVGMLTPEETATQMNLSGEGRGAGMLYIDRDGPRSAVLQVVNRRNNYRLRWQNQRVHARVHLELETELLTMPGGRVGTDPTLLEKLEEEAARLVRQQCEALVAKLQQEYRADTLALGERVRAFLPAAWASMEDWREAFGRTRFEFDVRVQVRRTGLTLQ